MIFQTYFLSYPSSLLGHPQGPHGRGHVCPGKEEKDRERAERQRQDEV